MVDQITVQFIDSNGATQSIQDWSEYNIQRDFFDPADGFTLVCEDDRADQLNSLMQVGQRLLFNLNNFTILVGYIDTMEYSYTRGGHGKMLIIRGRDICGILGDAVVYPNLGLGGTTDYQFNPDTTLSQAMNGIFLNGLTTITSLLTNGNGFNLAPLSNSTLGSQTAGQGFGTGIKSKAKTGRGISSSYQSNLKRLCKPEKEETYLHYASRLAKHAGAFIKCMPGSDAALFVGTPNYNTSNVPYSLQHYYQTEMRFNSNPVTANNIHDGKLRVSYKDQPSVIIGEATHGQANFRKQTTKVICINEFTGYIQGTTSLTIDNAIPNVKNAVEQLTTGAVGATNQNGYYLLAANNDLYTAADQNVIGIQTNFSRPYYYIDHNAQTVEELMIGVAELMATFQDKFFDLEYVVDQHSNNGYPWGINQMCSVADDTFGPPNKSLNGQYWIQKVNFIKSRSEGTQTVLTLRLPFTHVVNFTST